MTSLKALWKWPSLVQKLEVYLGKGQFQALFNVDKHFACQFLEVMWLDHLQGHCLKSKKLVS